ncbi:MAG: hypothetical protein HGA45_14080 [Chloroflexales bacterium]|nr:hypothetical protein [Chloroflexales bacterium]
MQLLPNVTQLLEALLDGVQEGLGDNLVGLYLRGSLAMGDFLPATSDVDVLAVPERPISDAEFSRLSALHAQLATLPNAYARRLEMAYIDRGALVRFALGRSQPSLSQGEDMRWDEHRDRWVLQRWVVRERGVPLLVRSLPLNHGVVTSFLDPDGNKLEVLYAAPLSGPIDYVHH